MKKPSTKSVIDSIPEIEGREFQYELDFEDPDAPKEFHTPLSVGASMLAVHTGVLSADRRTFPRLFQRIRASSGLTQAQFAERLGVRRQSVHQMEHGYRANPNLEIVLKWAAAAGCRVLIEYPRRVSLKE